MSREARRRFATMAFLALLLLHLGAFALYLLNERQFAFLEHWRDGREAWRTGRLELAASELRTFASGYRAASRPLLIRPDFPEEAQAWGALGQVEAALGRSQRAAGAFEKAARLGQESAWRERHALLWQLGDATRLEQQGRLRLETGHPEAREDLAAAALLRGHPDDAVRHYREALDALPAWLDRQRRPRRAADGGLVDEQLAIYLLAGVTGWLGGEAATGQHYCALLAEAQDAENPMDGLCRAATAVEQGDSASALAILAKTPVAAGEQAAFATEITRRAHHPAPVRQSALPSPMPADHPRH